jgi:hypothetical protein
MKYFAVKQSTFLLSLQAILSQLKNPPDVKVSNVISYVDFKDALKCWKEKTSTSPSGHHLGHYISLMTKIMLVIVQYCQNDTNSGKKRQKLCWKKTQEIRKLTNYKLHIICLYKADYNLFLKIMWAHQMVKVAEKHNVFDHSQSGGRPRRTSNNVTLRKMLVYTHSRITQTNFSSVDLGA